ncbi:MAG: hypothetical protein ACK40G_18185 [Cytophagaceae bacterium]
MKVYHFFLLLSFLSLSNNAIGRSEDSLFVKGDSISILFINIDSLLLEKGLDINKYKSKYFNGLTSQPYYAVKWLIENGSLFIEDIKFYVKKADRDSLRELLFKSTPSINGNDVVRRRIVKQ